nr:ASN_HP1_G0006300.mRNA.1.CDS.1 [Saccharomyces cerevisiae]
MRKTWLPCLPLVESNTLIVSLLLVMGQVPSIISLYLRVDLSFTLKFQIATGSP